MIWITDRSNDNRRTNKGQMRDMGMGRCAEDIGMGTLIVSCDNFFFFQIHFKQMIAEKDCYKKDFPL